MTKTTLRGHYDGHKSNAKQRGVGFNLSFSEWLKIWEESGHLHGRGKGKNKYCMARFGDNGAYEIGNVRIITNSENRKEWRMTEQQKQNLSAARKGNQNNKNSKKTHCPRGHPYAGSNVYLRKTGARGCRTCMLSQWR